jgi:hypothetical protein
LSILFFVFNDPNDPKHIASEYLRWLALRSFGALAWPNRDPKNPTMQNSHNVKIVVDNVKESFTIATLATKSQ